MCCGGAGTYLQFAIAYMTVGFGEAGGVPPSYSIISDYFPPGRRGRALGLYNIGPPIGAALGIAFGASIAAAFSWRYAFVLLGAVGLLAVIGIFLFFIMLHVCKGIGWLHGRIAEALLVRL